MVDVNKIGKNLIICVYLVSLNNLENSGNVKDFDNGQISLILENMLLFQFTFSRVCLKKFCVSCYGCVFLLYFSFIVHYLSNQVYLLNYDKCLFSILHSLVSNSFMSFVIAPQERRKPSITSWWFSPCLL